MVVEGQPFRDGFAMVTDSGRAVPEEKKWKASTRENSADKWKTIRAKHKGDAPINTIGALEISSELGLDFEEPYRPMLGEENDAEKWVRAHEAWKSEGLRSELIQASAGLPVTALCCGLIPDDEKRIKDMVPYLNEHFVPKANEKLKKHGFRIDAFLWWFHNLQGKSETTILLIRFFEVADS